MADVNDILDAFKAAESGRATWENHWQDIYDYMLPARTPVRGGAVAGEKRTDKVFDATATRFLRRLSSTLMGLMVGPSDRWFTLKAAGVDDGDVDSWLEATAEQLYAAYHASNFYSEMPETLTDLIALGTACLFVDEKPVTGPGFQGFHFSTLSAGEFYVAENDRGEVDQVFRLLRLTARQAQLRFGRDKLHASITDALQSGGGGGSGDQEYEFVHAVYRRDDPVLGGKQRDGDRSIAGAEWASAYVDRTNEVLVSDGGFRDQRYFTPRWSKASGETYGRGPAMDVLPDVKTLNTIVRYGLEGLILQVYPPWLFPDESVIGRLKLTPGARNIYDASVKGDIRPLIGAGNFAVEQAKEQELRQAIAQGFMDDVLGLRDQGDITATEVLDRRERRQQLTGPAVARIETELLDPLVSTTWTMMFRSGAFGQPPQALMNAERIEVQYVSPLARAQKMAPVRAMQDAFALLQPLAQAFPGMLDHYNFDAIARDLPEDLGVPRKWLVDADAVAKGRQQRAQAAQAQQALQQQLQMAETAAKVGGAAGASSDAAGVA